MALTTKDFASGTWTRLEKYLRAELETARTQLESHLLSDTASARIRGDIGRIRSLLALASPDTATAPGSRASGNRADDEAE